MSAQSNMDTKFRYIASQKLNYLAWYMCWCTILIVWKSNYPHRYVNAIALRIFSVAATVKLQKIFVINKSHFSPSEQGSKSDNTSWDYQACTHDTLWRQYYVTNSKEYL